MNLAYRIAFAAALVAGATAAGAAGLVEVSFPHKDPYIDAGRTPSEIARTERALEGHLKHLAPALAGGQTLHVEVLDIDLAGNIELRRGTELRIVRDAADWPRITLRYRLESGGELLKSGEEALADMNYRITLPHRDASAELPYEKHLLDTWFHERFAHPQPQ